MASREGTTPKIMKNICLPLHGSPDARWDVEIGDNRGHFKKADDSFYPDQLLLPPLCHPHIHVDKAYILTANNQSNDSEWPNYSDLLPKTGTFQEALENTSEAKKRYTDGDLERRGDQLLANCLAHGVTTMRAFAEIDHVTQGRAIFEALELKTRWKHLIHIQLCAFAQDPLFSTDHGEKNRDGLTLYIELTDEIEAIGTTPYVEKTREAAIQNIDFAIDLAITRGIHLDFHLDYNLNDPSGEKAPMVFDVIERLEKHHWLERAGPDKTIVLGHCTQLTRLSDSEMARLAKIIKDSKLPIHFVGLPTSDLYMMGRPAESPSDPSASSQSRPRGTLNVPALIKDHGLNACIGVNNVGNAFTPYGTGDPLQLACWGVGLYHAGTTTDAKLLYECISSRARKAIGLAELSGEDEEYFDTGNPDRKWKTGLIIQNDNVHRLPSKVPGESWTVPAKQRRSIQDVVWDPPESGQRSVLRRRWKYRAPSKNWYAEFVRDGII